MKAGLPEKLALISAPVKVGEKMAEISLPFNAGEKLAVKKNANFSSKPFFWRAESASASPVALRPQNLEYR